MVKTTFEHFFTVAIYLNFLFQNSRTVEKCFIFTCSFCTFKKLGLWYNTFIRLKKKHVDDLPPPPSPHVTISKCSYWKVLVSKSIINSFQTLWKNRQYSVQKMSIIKFTSTSQIRNIRFHNVWTYELLPISQKPLKISIWNFKCILQAHIGIRKYQYHNFDQVPHLDPKSHGGSHIVKWTDCLSQCLLKCIVCLLNGG